MFLRKRFHMQFHRLLSCQKHQRVNLLDIGCNYLANFTITTALAATSSNQRFLHTTNNNHSTATLSEKTTPPTNATSNEENVIDGNGALLDKKFLTFDQRVDGAQNILLKLQRGRSRTASFQISFQPKNGELFLSFPNISLPEDAYLMVREMDELIGALPTTALKAPATTNVDNVNGNVPEFLPGGRQFDGKYYGYGLNMCWWRGKLQFCMRTKQTVQEHRGRHVIMPAQALPWLRMEMAQMLRKHDGILLRRMPEIPKWILSDRSDNKIRKRPNNVLPKPDQRPRRTTTQLNMKNRRQQQQLQSVQHQNKPQQQQQQLITQLSAKIEQLQQQLSAITLNHSKDSNMAAQPEQQLTNQLAQLKMLIAQQMAQSTQMAMSMLNLFCPQFSQPLQQLAQPQPPQVAQQPLVQSSSFPFSLQQPQQLEPYDMRIEEQPQERTIQTDGVDKPGLDMQTEKNNYLQVTAADNTLDGIKRLILQIQKKKYPRQQEQEQPHMQQQRIPWHNRSSPNDEPNGPSPSPLYKQRPPLYIRRRRRTVFPQTEMQQQQPVVEEQQETLERPTHSGQQQENISIMEKSLNTTMGDNFLSGKKM